MRALSGPEEALQWLLSQLLRYSFCGICGNETKGLAHIRTKITFSSLASTSPSLLLSLILVWQHLEGTSQFYVRTSLIVVRNILRVVHRHSGDECFPQRLSLGGIQEGYSDCTLGGIRGKQGFNGEELGISLGCHQVYP